MEGSNKQRLKHLLVETIQVLCKNSLPDESSFCIEATIGITLSSDRVTVISFKEHINSDGSRVSLMITDEQDYEQQWSKKTNDETEKHRYESWPRSSCSNNNNEQHLASKYPAICQQSVIRQTRNISRSVDHEVGMLEDNVDSSTEPSRIALFGSTDVSTANHYSIPMIGKCCTVTQSPTDCQTDSNDDVVIFKVEEGTDNNAAAVSGVQQFGTEVEAPALHSRRNKPKHRRARFGGNVVHNRSVQPMTSTFLETDETQQQHIAESHQQTAASDECFDHTTPWLNTSNSATYSGNMWSQSKTLWSCSLCGAWLGSSRTLRNHVRKKHMALKTERCRLCGETFRWATQVVRHKRLCHPELL